MPNNTSSDASSAPKFAPKGNARLLLEYGPLILFFLVNYQFGIYWGTGVLVVSTLIALIISWMRDRHIPKLLAFGCLAVVIFGALTLIFEDETFIKIKPTVVSLIFASGLLLGLLARRNPLKAMLGEAVPFDVPDSAWRKLTMLWIAMFSSLAGANEVAWRTLSTDAWVTFKVFGLTGISLFFGVIFATLLSRYASPEGDKKS